MTQEITADKFIGKVLDERYEILRKIGEGGMARVYKALDYRLKREVAVKMMREELFHDTASRRAFYNEAHAVAMLSHPNIVSIYDVNNSGHAEYIVMELLNGVTLRQYIDKMRPIPWKQVLHFSKQISAALVHAHSKGIIHRDIKPQNMMILQNGDLKVADFGIAALENRLDADSGQAIGSLNYIAPEQLRGSPANAQGDVYSLGVVMYEMLTGFKPYTGKTPAEILLKLDSSELLPVRAFEQSVPSELEKIVERAMSVDPGTRYPDAQKLMDDLNRFMEKFIARGIEAKKSLTEKPQTPKSGHKAWKIEVTPRVKMTSKIDYLKSLHRANKITRSLGTFSIMTMIVLLFAWLWSFWARDLFSPAVRIEMPSFVGYSCDSVITNAELAERYKFSVEQVVDTETAAGTILAQDPQAGRSLMLTENGINVSLKVSSGYVMLNVEDVSGLDYREAALILQNAGFNVEMKNVTSSEVEKDLVISTSPSAGEQLTSGSTVYVSVSSGISLSYVTVPNVIGLPETSAVAKLEAAGLSCAGTEYETSDFEVGTVIRQSKAAFTEAEEHSGVILTVSSGPWG